MASNKKKKYKILFRMKKNIFVLFFIILALLIMLIVKLAYINLKSGETYERIVLSQKNYGTSTIPFCRGDIVDRKGTVLATSTDVYNVILDCSAILSRDTYLEPTVEAVAECFDLDAEELKQDIQDHPNRQYLPVAKKVPYEQVEKFKALESADSDEDSEATDEEKENAAYIKGVSFEKEYVRNYPYSTLASSIIGFVASGNEGIGGLEGYYNDTLNGTDGKEYGYLNSDSNYEVNVKEAVNGETIVSTIDINLQSIVESKIEEFENALGAEHIGVIMMDPNTGEVLAMANNNSFDLSDPWDLTAFYSDEEIEELEENQELVDNGADSSEVGTTRLEALNDIWENFCTTYTYEPGSTVKPFTIAAGLESGALSGDETYYCDGHEKIADYDIKCINTSGHGTETIKQALENSCNDALMQMSYAIGAHTFAKYQQAFNFGLKTNIDLPGEARTADLIYQEDELNTINLATNSFGQNYNVTMIQVISAYCSLVNGGTYYQPHIVSRIEDENGNTVERIEPTVLKQTVSAETSETMLDYLEGVVTEGSGTKAKVDGYSMGGKTGTAEKLPRSEEKFLVSFIGNVPAEDPQVCIYVVVDEAHTSDQAHSYFAQSIAREILEEALPYLGIYPDEEETGVNAEFGITGMTDDTLEEVRQEWAQIEKEEAREEAAEKAAREAASEADDTESDDSESDDTETDNTTEIDDTGENAEG